MKVQIKNPFLVNEEDPNYNTFQVIGSSDKLPKDFIIDVTPFETRDDMFMWNGIPIVDDMIEEYTELISKAMQYMYHLNDDEDCGLVTEDLNRYKISYDLKMYIIKEHNLDINYIDGAHFITVDEDKVFNFKDEFTNLLMIFNLIHH